MDYRVASGILWSSAVTLVFRWSQYSLFSVVFPFITSILMFACARKCSKVLPSDAVVGGAHFFIMHENKKSHWVKWDKPYNNARQTIGNTHWDNCSVGFFFFSFFLFKKNKGSCLKCCGCL